MKEKIIYMTQYEDIWLVGQATQTSYHEEKYDDRKRKPLPPSGLTPRPGPGQRADPLSHF
jgi:hypothetical protein